MVRRVHPGSLSSLGCALGAVEFIRGRWVHYSAPWEPSCSSWVAGFTRRRPGVFQVHPGSLVSLGGAVVFVGFILGR